MNWTDPMGLIVHYRGSPEEVALMKSWVDKLKECAKCLDDEELKKRLKEVLEGPYHHYIGFESGSGAGGYNPRGLQRGKKQTVRLDPILKNPNQEGEYYTAKRSKNGPSTGYYRGPDALAHELLGHAYDYSQRDKGDNQRMAIDLANLIRKCMGNEQPQRAY